MKRILTWVYGALWLCGCVRPETPKVPSALPPALAWRAFDPAAFAAAAREHKLILLSVQANFCHWCHVMNATTYRDPRVVALLSAHFVTIRLDESERPDLASRYADYGWPATALLTPSAEPIVTLRGYREAGAFSALLRALTAKLARGEELTLPPAAEPPSADADLTEARDLALAQLDALYDAAEGGWGGPQKYPFAAPVDHALWRAQAYGEEARLAAALATLRGHAALLDRVGGGMFQYSVGGTWSAPHYEKLASIQAGALLNFSAAFALTRDERWLSSAREVARYVRETLRTPSGAFAASQSADVGEWGEPGFVEGARYYAAPASERAELGAPALDAHVYANLNGLLIQGLCALYRASGDRDALLAAQAALTSVLLSHGEGAGFRHAADDRSGRLHLSDQVEMAGALWEVADATGDVALRERAFAAIDLGIERLEDRKSGGFYAYTAERDAVGLFARREKPVAENARLARLMLRRARLAHEPAQSERAEKALRALSGVRTVRAQGRKVGDLLIALEEATGPYVRVTVVGPKNDPRTRALYEAAYRAQVLHGPLRLDAPGEGPYPYPGEPAAYLCSESACSRDITRADELAQAVADFVRKARAN